MSPPDAITDFLAKLRVELRLRPDGAERVMAEVEDHLMETFKVMTGEGVPKDEAARLAIARFGNPEEVARAFDREERGSPRMKAFLRRLTFNLIACYAAASVYHLIQQLLWLLLAFVTTRSVGVEFHSGLLILVPEIRHSTPLSPSMQRLDRFWFLLAPALVLLCVFFSIVILRWVGPRVRLFLTYIVTFFSASLILTYLPFVAWGGGWFGEEVCEVLPSVCSSMLAFRWLLGVGGGGLLLLVNFVALSRLLGSERRTWKSQLADLSGWVVAISLITLMVYTQLFLRWDVFVEASLAVVLALGAMCGLPAVLLARYRRIAT